MMRVIVDENKKVWGYGAFADEGIPYEWEDFPGALIDKFGSPLYEWDGEKPVRVEPEPTEEQRDRFADKVVRLELPKLLCQSIKLGETWEQFCQGVKSLHQEIRNEKGGETWEQRMLGEQVEES